MGQRSSSPPSETTLSQAETPELPSELWREICEKLSIDAIARCDEYCMYRWLVSRADEPWYRSAREGSFVSSLRYYECAKKNAYARSRFVANDLLFKVLGEVRSSLVAVRNVGLVSKNLHVASKTDVFVAVSRFRRKVQFIAGRRVIRRDTPTLSDWLKSGAWTAFDDEDSEDRFIILEFLGNTKMFLDRLKKRRTEFRGDRTSNRIEEEEVEDLSKTEIGALLLGE